MYTIYQVMPGDNLQVISDKFNTSIENLRKINSLPFNYDLTVGEQIIVPSISKEPFIYYTIQKGDNMYEIARKYNVDLNTLLRINGLNKDDYKIINDFFKTLGNSGVTGQERIFSLALDNIDINYKEAKKLEKENEFFNIKFMDFNEIKEHLYFSYDYNSIKYLTKKYNYKYDIAKMYIDNIYYVSDKNYKSKKLNKLVSLKRELDENKLLIYDGVFKTYIKDKKILKEWKKQKQSVALKKKEPKMTKEQEESMENFLKQINYKGKGG